MACWNTWGIEMRSSQSSITCWMTTKPRGSGYKSLPKKAPQFALQLPLFGTRPVSRRKRKGRRDCSRSSTGCRFLRCLLTEHCIFLWQRRSVLRPVVFWGAGLSSFSCVEMQYGAHVLQIWRSSGWNWAAVRNDLSMISRSAAVGGHGNDWWCWPGIPGAAVGGPLRRPGAMMAFTWYVLSGVAPAPDNPGIGWQNFNRKPRAFWVRHPWFSQGTVWQVMKVAVLVLSWKSPMEFVWFCGAWREAWSSWWGESA